MRELALHILDVVENSLAAGATRIAIRVEEDLAQDSLTITVEDNGRGMDQETMGRAVDPFFSTRATRRVGLGLPLLKAAAERCNGWLRIESTPGQGTQVVARFQHSHVDRAPLGNMAATLMGILLSDRLGDLRYVHTVNGRSFQLDTAEIRRELAGAPLSHPAVRSWLQEYLREGEASLWESSARDMSGA